MISVIAQVGNSPVFGGTEFAKIMEMLYRPLGDSFDQAPLQELHRATLLWNSELDFWMEELNFFRSLIGEHFRQMITDSHFIHTQELVKMITNLRETIVPEIQTDLLNHEKHLAAILENPFSYEINDPDEPQADLPYREEHKRLEQAIIAVMKALKALKREMFSYAENILREENTPLKLEK